MTDAEKTAICLACPLATCNESSPLCGYKKIATATKNAKARERYQNDAEFRQQIKEQSRQWRIANRERRNEYQRDWFARRRKARPADVVNRQVATI